MQHLIAGVARGCNNDHAPGECVVDCHLLAEAVTAGTQAHIDHMGTVIRCIDNRANQVLVCSDGIAENVDRHDRCRSGETGNSYTIVDPRSCNASHVGAMSVVVIGRVVLTGKVPAMVVIDESIAFIIDPIAGNLSGVGPNGASQILMSHIHASIEHSDDDLGAATGQVPGASSVDPFQVRRLPGFDGVVMRIIRNEIKL